VQGDTEAHHRIIARPAQGQLELVAWRLHQIAAPHRLMAAVGQFASGTGLPAGDDADHLAAIERPDRRRDGQRLVARHGIGEQDLGRADQADAGVMQGDRWVHARC